MINSNWTSFQLRSSLKQIWAIKKKVNSKILRQEKKISHLNEKAS